MSQSRDLVSDLHGLPTVGVVYDFGAAGPFEIVSAARDRFRVIFILNEGVYKSDVINVLKALAPVVECQQALTSSDLGLNALTTYSDRAVAITSELGVALELDVNDLVTARRLTQKGLQRAALQAAGMQDMRWENLSSIEDAVAALELLGGEAILKLKQGEGSQGILHVTSASQIESHITASNYPIDWFILEEFLRGDPRMAGPEWGDYVSVETVSVRGNHQVMAVLGKPHLAEGFREHGHVFPATLAPDVARSVEMIAALALDAVGVKVGVCHVEIKLTPSGPKVIEVNGRLGGGVAAVLNAATGQDPVAWAMSAALGALPEPIAAPERVVMEYMIRGGPSRSSDQLQSAVEQVRGIPGVNYVRLARADPESIEARKIVSHDAEVLLEATSHCEAIAVVEEIKRIWS